MKVTIAKTFDGRFHHIYFFQAKKTEELLDKQCDACGNYKFAEGGLSLTSYRFGLLFPKLDLQSGEWCVADISLKEE
jgi:hypothetical protein